MLVVFCTAIIKVDSKYIFLGQELLICRHTFSVYGQYTYINRQGDLIYVHTRTKNRHW